MKLPKAASRLRWFLVTEIIGVIVSSSLSMVTNTSSNHHPLDSSTMSHSLPIYSHHIGLGGEAISLSMTHPSAADFRAAGYQYISTNGSFRGGVVRQDNKISFSRIFDAGHAVGAYQPETVSKIFDRVMLDKDVGTGSIDLNQNASYSSSGPVSSFGIKNELPSSPKNECYLWDAIITCTEEELLLLASGAAVMKDYMIV